MLGTIPKTVLTVGFVVQMFAVLLSSPYTPHDFALIRASNAASEENVQQKQQHEYDLNNVQNVLDTYANTPAPPVKLHRVLFLTAHPDDESMFFAPTLIGFNTTLLTTPGRLPPDQQTAAGLSPKIPIPKDLNPRDAWEVYVLCLSPGGEVGGNLAKVRVGEFGRSLGVLGVEEGRRWVLERPFEDNITLTWDADMIAWHVKPYVEKYGIEMIFTFDEHGVSSHPNHISLYHGAKRLLQHLTNTSHTSTSTPPLRLFTLHTTTLPTKFTGAFGALLSRLYISTCILHRLASPPDWPLAARLGDALNCPRKENMTFVSSFRGYLVGLAAMVCHRSQMVWFRWLWLGWSRYLWVNEWVEVGL